MPRKFPKPFFRSARNCWFVQIGGKQVRLHPDEAEAMRLYHELIHTVRAAYPRAFIVCALGSMLSDVYPEGRNNLTQARKYMRTAVTTLKESGDTNLALLEFPEQKWCFLARPCIRKLSNGTISAIFFAGCCKPLLPEEDGFLAPLLAF